MPDEFCDELGAFPELRPALPKRMTVEQIEQLLQQDENMPITILPNGEVRAATEQERRDRPKHPLTFRENLGGEYGVEPCRA